MTRFSFPRFVTRLAGAVALASLFISVPHLARADAVTDANLAAKMESAKTAADHQAIAQYYLDKAAESDKTAAMHESMLKGVKTVGGKPYEIWRGHCQILIAKYKELAAEYRKLAADHEQMAKDAK